MERTYLVITVIGPDKQGIVARLSEVVVQSQGNIEESRMARLGGEFAVIMLVSIPASRRDGLPEKLESLKSEGLTIFAKPTDLARVQALAGHVPYEITVRGADHEGIVNRVADYLARERINVETMDTMVTPAPHTGTPMFSMRASVQAPPGVTLQQLRATLTAVGDESGADIEVKLGTA
ncbi:MAG: transcriptional regulator [Spirochaetes bacterium]|nr:transcriptional regulator [Spirochaetota bacterium]